MPRMDGKELIRELRNHSPELPIIVLTGQLGLTEDLDEEIRPHVRQVLKKPVSLRVLEDAILDAMRCD